MADYGGGRFGKTVHLIATCVGHYSLQSVMTDIAQRSRQERE